MESADGSGSARTGHNGLQQRNLSARRGRAIQETHCGVRPARGVPEVDDGRDQQVWRGEGLRSVLACLPSPRGDGLWSGRLSTWRCAVPLSDPALLPVGGGQGGRDPGAAPRACAAAPPAPAASPAIHRPCAAGGAEPGAPTGALVGVPGTARDAAALASAHGPPGLDLPDHLRRPTADLRADPATGHSPCPREPAVGLAAHPRRDPAVWRSGVGQLDPAGAARSRS